MNKNSPDLPPPDWKPYSPYEPEKKPAGSPTELGDGYRYLEVGELIKSNDQVWGVSIRWQNTSFAGRRVGDQFCNCYYRRKCDMPVYEFDFC